MTVTEGSCWPPAYWWWRIRAVLMSVLESNQSLKGQCGYSLTHLVQHHCGSCVRNESMLRFVFVVGLSPAVFPFHLHGSDNNKWTGRFEIRLRDPQLQRKKRINPHVWDTNCGTFLAKTRKCKNTARITSIPTRGVNSDYPVSLSNVVVMVGHHKTYLCNSVTIFRDINEGNWYETLCILPVSGT